MLQYATVIQIETVEGERYLVAERGTGGIIVTEYPEDRSPQVGDAVFLNGHDEFVEIAESGGIGRGNSLGVVETTVGDRIVINTGVSLITVENPLDLEIKNGYTVEYTNAGTIREVVDKSPIRAISTSGPETDIGDFIASLRVPSNELGVGFDDYGGMTDELYDVQQRIEVLLNKREELQAVGNEVRLGAVFYGPPGTGKTHFARILAAESDATFYRIRGPEIVTQLVGETEEILRALFKDASQHEPSIIFFDEVDSLGGERGTGQNQQFGNRVVAQLLALMDGVDQENDGLLIIGSTNRIEDMDDALLRPGRLDWKVAFKEPSQEGRVEIFDALRTRYTVDEGVSSDQIAAITEGWSGADLEALLDEASIVCVDDGRDEITMMDLMISHERVNRQSK
ncbi:ATP-binding protein [Haladaptatus sp. NG-WS-4]